MDSSGSVFSQTLQEITTAKLEELAKKRSSFEKKKADTIKNAEKSKDPISMLTALADGTRSCFSVRIRNGKIIRGSSGNPRLENDLRNLNRFIDQARFDPSVSSNIIQQWRETLLRHLEVQSLKYQYADLYGKLTMEWLTSSIPKVKVPNSEEMDISEDFEKVSARAKLEARQNWERNVFEEARVDQDAIKQFLGQLFSTKESQKALSQLRNDIKSIEQTLSSTNQFNINSLHWVIDGLLASDLLTNEKRQALRDFKSNQVILTELADVLNMRMAALSSWSWGEEVSVEVRRQVSGTFNIYMHEDLLQAIFLQYIGVQWSVKIKEALLRFQEKPDVWNHGYRKLSPIETQRRGWYLSSSNYGMNVQKVRSSIYRGGYFVSQLMDDVRQDHEAQEGEEEANFAEFASAKRKSAASQGVQVQHMMMQQAPQHAVAAGQGPRQFKRSMPAHFRRDDSIQLDVADEDMGFGLFDDVASPDPRTYKPKNPMDAKQRLLHLLSTEILVKTKLQGEITCFRSQFKAWNPLLPHGTVGTVLAFFGVSHKWLSFFKTFLQAPLKFLGEDEEPRQRRRGTPGAHVISDFFGETTLFCLDYAINQRTEGEVLWRMHDDFWFWSASHETCVKAWRIIKLFNMVMGVDLDSDKSAAVRMQYKSGTIQPAELDKTLPSGDIRWGMIFLDEKTGRFTIDKGMVDKHIEELRRQLKDKERSIFSWVQAYSTYASVFFTSNFGKPANCFGREHLDAMLSMQERVQRTLFSGSENDGISSAVDWLKKQIEQRFGVGDIPDGYLFFPTSLGGLDVKSPFIGLLQLRDSVTEDPNALFEKFVQAEQDNYNDQKKKYLATKKWEYPMRQGEYRPQEPLTFMPFDEYSRYREELNYGYGNQLVDIYQTLLERPREEPLENDDNMQITEALNRIKDAYGQEQTMTNWHSMNPYWKWVTMLYGPEMIRNFGSFEIVDAGLLPMGMVSLFKSGRVSWQE